MGESLRLLRALSFESLCAATGCAVKPWSQGAGGRAPMLWQRRSGAAGAGSGSGRYGGNSVTGSPHCVVGEASGAKGLHPLEAQYDFKVSGCLAWGNALAPGIVQRSQVWRDPEKRKPCRRQGFLEENIPPRPRAASLGTRRGPSFMTRSHWRMRRTLGASAACGRLAVVISSCDR